MTEENFSDKYREILKRLRLIDDIFFSVFFDNNPDDVQYILRIILDKPDLKVLEVQTQKGVENIFGRSVRFDVFATDDKGKLYNIEVQRADSGAVPTRARYNSSMLDYHKLKEQAKFDELPETFVIFITENDVLKDGKQIYHIDRIIRETGKIFGDGTHIVYVNGSYRDDSGSALGDLVHDFFCENPDNMRHYQLAERVEFLKGTQNEMEMSEVSRVRELVREFYKDEIAEESQKAAQEKAQEIAQKMAQEIAQKKAQEIAQKKVQEIAQKAEKANLLNNIHSLMQKLNLTAQGAMDALSVSPELQKELLPLI